MAHVKTIGLRTKVCIPWLLLLVTLSTFKLAGAEDPNGTSNDAKRFHYRGQSSMKMETRSRKQRLCSVPLQREKANEREQLRTKMANTHWS